MKNTTITDGGAPYNTNRKDTMNYSDCDIDSQIEVTIAIRLLFAEKIMEDGEVDRSSHNYSAWDCKFIKSIANHGRSKHVAAPLSQHQIDVVKNKITTDDGRRLIEIALEMEGKDITKIFYERFPEYKRLPRHKLLDYDYDPDEYDSRTGFYTGGGPLSGARDWND